MSSADLSIHPGLHSATRLERLVSGSSRILAWEWIVLSLCGATAALASGFLDFNLRLPGHAILRVVFPMTAGLALVPRRGAGLVVGGAGLATALLLRGCGFGGDGLSLGALTSLAATGPLLDLSLWRVASGLRLYTAVAIAGLASNLLAFGVRGGAKYLGFEHVGARGLVSWLAQAAWSYPLCGLLAGLACGVLWFYSRPRRDREEEPAA